MHGNDEDHVAGGEGDTLKESSVERNGCRNQGGKGGSHTPRFFRIF